MFFRIRNEDRYVNNISCMVLEFLYDVLKIVILINFKVKVDVYVFVFMLLEKYFFYVDWYFFMGELMINWSF